MLYLPLPALNAGRLSIVDPRSVNLASLQGEHSKAPFAGCGWILAATALCCAVGCSQNPYMLQNEVATLKQQQTTLAQQNDELQRRAQLLDQENQDTQSMLAQSRQHRQLLEDEVVALRDQLKSAANQLVQASTTPPRADVPAETVAERRRPRATITANTNMSRDLPRLNIPGVEVRADGDVIRIELAGSRLFEAGDATLRAGSERTLVDVAAEIKLRYRNHMIGIEGHTDSDPIRTNHRFTSNHHLSSARATAVYDLLVTRTGLEPRQLFVVGHGPNHPVVSNATVAGKERNRRVELVIYPDQFGQ